MKTKFFRWVADTQEGAALVRTVEGELVADCTIFFAGKNRHAENQANARLIATAPELLEALHYVLGNHHEGDGEFNNIVRNAIAKAEGRDL